MSDDPPIHWLHVYFSAFNNGPDYGTGAKLLRDQTVNLMGTPVPKFLSDYLISQQNNLLGGYPTDWDFAPSVTFAVIFFALAVVHLLIWSINFSRGHYFHISLVWVIYCAMRVVGWALRAYWGKNILMIEAGIASEVFLIISSMVVVSFNLILAQRLFTWRHPVGGSRRLFWNIMLTLYFIVFLVVAMTIVAAVVPYLYFLSAAAYRSYKIVVMVSCVLIVMYSLTSISLLGLSYFFKPTAKDENLYTYQPWWIESFHPLYFVQPQAAQKAEETFMKRNHNHRHAIRVIAATHHHYKMVEGLTNQRGELGHNISIMLICVTTLLIFIGAILRCILMFQDNMNKHATSLGKPIVAYIIWGVFEVIVNLLYVVGRVDLRFYRPDILPAKVRAIITAEQTGAPSIDEDELSSSFAFHDNEEKSFVTGSSAKSDTPEMLPDNESEFRF